MLVTVFFALTSEAFAQEIVDSRVSISLKGGQEISEDLTVFGTFFPTLNAVAGLSPNGYLGVHWQAFEFLKVSPAIGFNYTENALIFSLRLSPKWNDFWGWFDCEYGLNDFGWNFGQLEWQAIKWLAVGAEYELKGSYLTLDEWNLGGGPNLVFSLGNFSLSLAGQFRQIGKFEPVFQFVSRVEVKLF